MEQTLFPKRAWTPPLNRLDLCCVTRSRTASTSQELQVAIKIAMTLLRWTEQWDVISLGEGFVNEAKCVQKRVSWHKKIEPSRGRPVPMVTGGFRETTSDMHFGVQSSQSNNWAITQTDKVPSLSTCSYSLSFTLCMYLYEKKVCL